MLCPNTQAVTHGYSTGWGPRPFPLNVLKFGFGDWKNIYEKRRPNPIFPKIPRKLDVWMGENGKKYMKREENKYLF